MLSNYLVKAAQVLADAQPLLNRAPYRTFDVRPGLRRHASRHLLCVPHQVSQGQDAAGRGAGSQGDDPQAGQPGVRADRNEYPPGAHHPVQDVHRLAQGRHGLRQVAQAPSFDPDS